MPHFDWTQWGIAGAVIAVLFFILWRMLVWVMKWVDKQAEQYRQEREAWIAAFNAHTEQAKAFHESVKEAHNYQREEHKEFAKQMQEVTSALGRINGYHKE